VRRTPLATGWTAEVGYLADRFPDGGCQWPVGGSIAHHGVSNTDLPPSDRNDPAVLDSPGARVGRSAINCDGE
jgi:hypothetical protein